MHASRAPVTADAKQVRHVVETALDERIRALRPFMLRASGQSDMPTLLRSLRNGGAGVIRHPPVAAQTVLTLCRKSSVGTSELTTMIERDPVLVQGVLRHANSAFYAKAGGAPVSAVGPAIQRIGTNGLHATVMSRIIEGRVSRPGAEYALMAKQVWDHMVSVAPLARSLAPAFGVDAEEAYTLGLLHDAGKLVFFDTVSDLRQKVRRAVGLTPEFVTEALATLHEPLGGLVCLEWGLVPGFARAVAGHHRVDPGPDIDRPAELLYLVERLDMARIKGEALDLEAAWEEGRLTVTRSDAEQLLAEHAPEYELGGATAATA